MAKEDIRKGSLDAWIYRTPWAKNKPNKSMNKLARVCQEMHDKKGYYYQKWKKAVRRAVGS